MIVKTLLKKIGINSEDTREIKGVSFDSRNIKEGYIFIAYKGENYDGNDYIYHAFNNGALCVISDRLVGYDIYKSNNIEKDKQILVKEVYKTDGIKLIGITGTNGKTSSAHLLYQSLNHMGIRTCYIGTLGIIDGDYKIEIDNTTPNMDVLAREIVKAKKRKCEYIVMEVSSHSLSMDRVKIFNFDVIAFTNFSQDHLDYYKDMDRYFNAKKILFDSASKNCIGIINNEDEYSNKIIKDFKGKVIRYGSYSEYDYKIIKNDLDGLIIKINSMILSSPLIYKTNLFNLLLTYTMLSVLGYRKNDIIEALSNSKTIDGRAEVLYRKDYYIILDYAHTPDAMERIITETNNIKRGNLIVLFGCGGNRDRLKRSIMGTIASNGADKIYLTNDNPRYEDELEIINDILLGVKDRDKVRVILDREKAINDAINNMKKDDILLILGKGHEEYQIIKNQKIHLSDREIVYACINK